MAASVLGPEQSVLPRELAGSPILWVVSKIHFLKKHLSWLLNIKEYVNESNLAF